MDDPAEQLDLFSASGPPRDTPAPAPDRPGGIAPEALDDTALMAAIPSASMADAPRLAAEAARRRLTAAIPALEQLCRRLKGMCFVRPPPEQAAALAALAGIGGPEAGRAVVRLITRGDVAGATLAVAVAVAARLDATLPADAAVPLLRHADPAVRADACRCAGASPEVATILVDLLDDLRRGVAHQAACALGRMGRPEARPALLRLLRDAPTADAIDAIAAIADEEAVVLLGRIAGSDPGLGAVARGALETIDHPRAARLLDSLCRDA